MMDQLGQVVSMVLEIKLPYLWLQIVDGNTQIILVQWEILTIQNIKTSRVSQPLRVATATTLVPSATIEEPTDGGILQRAMRVVRGTGN